MKVVLALVGAVVAVVGIVLLREATMSRHQTMEARSEMEMVVRASSNVDEADLEEMVTALFAICQLDVRTEGVGGPTAMGDDTFSFRMQPALDPTDQRQIIGCMEDARLDRLQAKVRSLEEVPFAPE